MAPAGIVVGALGRVRQPAVGKADERAVAPFEQVDFDQAGSGRNLLAPLPAEAVGEAVDRHDLLERPPRYAPGVAADPLDEIKAAGMRVGCRLGAHPAQNLFRIGQEGENGGARGRDIGLTLDDKGVRHGASG